MSDVTVSSTTDSIDDVREAAGLSAEEAAVEQIETEQPLEVEGHDTEEVEAESSEAEGEGEGEYGAEKKPETRRPKTSVQKRIDKLTAKNYQLEEEKESARRESSELKQRLERLEAAVNGKKDEPAKAAEFGKPRPDQKSYEDYDKFIEDLTDWKLEKKDFEKNLEVQKTAQNEVNARANDNFAAFERGMKAKRLEYDDFDETLDVTVTDAVRVALVEMREDGAELAYRLGKDADFIAKVNEVAQKRGFAAAQVEFGKWIAANFDEPGTEQVEPARQVAKKPAPIKPVGGNGTKTNVPMDELSFRDFRRVRDEAEKARYRR